MQFSLISLIAGRYHQPGAVVLMRGETFIETIEEGGMAAIVFFRGTATISRQRVGSQVGIHLTPRSGEPVWAMESFMATMPSDIALPVSNRSNSVTHAYR